MSLILLYDAVVYPHVTECRIIYLTHCMFFNLKTHAKSSLVYETSGRITMNCLPFYLLDIQGISND